jgi:hypothetical protein
VTGNVAVRVLRSGRAVPNLRSMCKILRVKPSPDSRFANCTLNQPAVYNGAFATGAGTGPRRRISAIDAVFYGVNPKRLSVLLRD